MKHQAPSPARFLPGVHAFRGIAALLVVCHHAYRSLLQHWDVTRLSEFFIGGAGGVQFFFVLSGFIIFYIHRNDDRSLAAAAKFLRKRLIRIYPIYWVVLLPVLVLFFTVPSFVPELSRSIWMVFENLLLLPTDGPRAIAIAWTLAHEMLFYLVFLTCFYGVRRLWSSLAFWVLMILAYQIQLRQGDQAFHHYLADFIFDINNLFFVVGIGTCLLFSHLKESPDQLKRKAFYWFCLSSGGLGFVGVLWWSMHKGFDRNYDGWDFVIERGLFALSSALLILSEPLCGSFRWFRNRVFKMLGDASYSIYLCHALVQTFLDKILSRFAGSWLSGSEMFWVLLFIPCLVGIALHYGIERPILSFFGKKLRPKPVAV